MSPPDAAPAFAALLRETADAPVFAAPWQAEAFALAVQLHATGAFTWAEWAEALAGRLKAADTHGEPDDGSRYYEHWCAALEDLVLARGLLGAEALAARRAAWAEAYARTPHGRPVEL